MGTRTLVLCGLALIVSAAPSIGQSTRRGTRGSTAARLGGTWIGQDGHDFVGPSAEPKPSGVQDLHIRLGGLPQSAITQLVVQGFGGDEWQFGSGNQSWAAYIQRKAGAATADVFLEPTRVEAGRAFTFKITFDDGRSTEFFVEGGKANPALRVASATLHATWLGQQGVDACGDSPSVGPDGYIDAQIKLGNITPTVEIQALTIVAPDGKTWEYGTNPKGHASAELRPAKGEARLLFQPDRDRKGQTLRIDIAYANGTRDEARVVAGSLNPRLPVKATTVPSRSSAAPRQVAARQSRPRPTRRVRATPGDDLQSLVAGGGTIELSAGKYRLNRPLTLEEPTEIIGSRKRERDASSHDTVLLFDQPADSPAWTTALKIHAGNTALRGFSIRFAGPVRWDGEVSYGPAVIGTTDNRDTRHDDPRTNLVFERLDLEGPPPATQQEEAPRLLRLVSASNGAIAECRLRGGAIEIFGGPWHIHHNIHLGTHPGSFAFSVISAHRTRGLLVENNETDTIEPSGKLWRFLVMTNGGVGDVVRSNRIAKVGPRDTDTVDVNAPEIILTESYRLRFEGLPLSISGDGRVVRVAEPQGGPADVDDVVAVLDGKHAGAWRRIVERIDERTYVVDPPLPIDEFIPTISIADNGFISETFEGNTIDAMGSKKAAGFVLAGHHYGTRVANNTVRGCGEAFRIVACPTEAPVHWGWSHAPVFGLRFEGNRIEKATRGATLAVEHGPPVKSSRGRLYFEGAASGNRFSPASPGLSIEGLEGEIRVERR